MIKKSAPTCGGVSGKPTKGVAVFDRKPKERDNESHSTIENAIQDAKQQSFLFHFPFIETLASTYELSI